MIPFRPENRPGSRILFTPGPLTTTPSVRGAMDQDIGSWDRDAIELVAEVRAGILALAGGRADYTTTLIQGSGSYAIESILGSALPRDGKLLILSNGAYGRRMRLTADALRIPYCLHEDPEDRPHDPAVVDQLLRADPSITHVGCVHCETTAGLLNPLREVGLVVKQHGRRFIADVISSFGAYEVGPGRPIDLDAGPIDHLAGSANKCIEGVPGFAFVISRRDAMERATGTARSLCLDLHAQWSHFEKTGQFRFTPPTHVLLAFRQALRELEAEGGPPARAIRYRESQETLAAGMRKLGFRPYVSPEHQSHIITTFHYPEADFDFRSFYDRLHKRGYILYPGKLTAVNTFRIANIGSIGRREIESLLGAIAEVRGGL
ncbi:MAG TPA: 2-aminoethylphosphonate--pyruvate transaminase [Planctomycetota bacterium]|nr:2-aminoethylphosphonate--pyruvate transaminase [Planctomycetota bacterium]